MCSILGIFTKKPIDNQKELRDLAIKQSLKQRHRGPDWSGIYAHPQCILVHERLSIVDPTGGSQPLLSSDGRLSLAVNGEIYNHKELKKEFSEYDYQSASDCEVINPLYLKHGPAFLPFLNGIFAFCLWDSTNKSYLIARDPFGVCPLYLGYDKNRNLWVSSEMKSLVEVCEEIQVFPPGQYLDSTTNEFKSFWTPSWRNYQNTINVKIETLMLRESFEKAVHRQLMTDVPYGVLLSGGLDSSIVAATAMKFASKRIEEDDKTKAWWPTLHSFAIGLEGSPDLKAAAIAARYIGTVHHEFKYTVQEGIDAINDVIYHIETYDVTTIRASTPMYLLARRIKAMGVKMVLSGEGSDEIFGGYLYFHKAPNAQEFHEETVRKLDALHLFDCARANKAMSAWGVEARVPFLDLEFIHTAMSFDAKEKMVGSKKIEKQILREAFVGMLPDEILWRQKEQFSDGVGYSWIDSLKNMAENAITDEDFKNSQASYSVNPPATKEALYYRRIFDLHFPKDSCASTVPGGKSIACSTPNALLWDKNFLHSIDPSGRAIKDVHQNS